LFSNSKKDDGMGLQFHFTMNHPRLLSEKKTAAATKEGFERGIQPG
jgi:hypothetical protein